MTESKIKDCAEVAGQVAVGAAMAALFAVWCGGTADARPIPVDAIDGTPANAAKPVPKAPVKAETPKESADRETRKFQNDIARDQKQQKKESDERKSDENRENRKFRNDIDRDEKQQQKEKEKNEDADRENRKFQNDIRRDAQQQAKEKEDERKSDDERENRKFRNQIVQDREAEARHKDADRENDRFLAQIERDRPKDTTPNGTTRSVKAWETAQEVAKDADAARATAYDLAATRNKGATGSVRAWETTAQLADEAELAAQKLEYVRDVGLPQTPLPPASFNYNKNVSSPNYAGDAAETIEGVDWQRFPGAPGGIPVGVTKDGSKVVVVKDPITPEAPLSPEMMKYLGAGNFVDRGQTADGSTVLVLHPRTHIDDNADDLAAQWDNVFSGRIEGPDDVGRAVGGTIALTLDRTIGLGQGDLYGAGKKCQDTGECGDSFKEAGLTALSVAPLGRVAGIVGKGAVATGRAAERVLPPAITAIPGRAAEGVRGVAKLTGPARAAEAGVDAANAGRAAARSGVDDADRGLAPTVRTGETAGVTSAATSALPRTARPTPATEIPTVPTAGYRPAAPPSTAAGAAARDARPFRPPNPSFPPNSRAVQAMKGLPIEDCKFDCSEIADSLQRAANDGKIVEFRAAGDFAPLRVPEGSGISDYVYHQVYTDGRYAFDPRLSSVPIPWGDYWRMMKKLNPGMRVHGL